LTNIENNEFLSLKICYNDTKIKSDSACVKRAEFISARALLFLYKRRQQRRGKNEL